MAGNAVSHCGVRLSLGHDGPANVGRWPAGRVAYWALPLYGFVFVLACVGLGMSLRQTGRRPSAGPAQAASETARAPIAERRLRAAPLPPAQAEQGPPVAAGPRPVVDYSPYVTLVRDQSMTHLCAEYCTATVVDILKERERSYTPDISPSFLNYAYQVSIGYYPKDPRLAIPGEGQAGVVRNLGAVPEAVFSSRNYDPANLAGRPTCSEEVPGDAAIADAHWLRIAAHRAQGIGGSGGMEYLKSLLAKGPVTVLYRAHCTALIGYDDNRQQFTFVDSSGELGPDRGFFRWSYREMEERLGALWVTAITNAETPRDAYPFVARIRVVTPRGRDNLTLRVGVAGEAPLTVWGPAPHGARDRGQALTIDVPLPRYAAQHWPPSAQNRWYVEMSYPGQGGGVLKEATLVNRAFTSRGEYRPVLFRPAGSNYPVPASGPLKVEFAR